MPVFYNFTQQDGLTYSFDDVFVPADFFREGNLWAWGFNNAGRLGNATAAFDNISTPVTTFSGGTNWKQVSCGDNFMVAIKTDGTLWTWGNAANGRLGNASTVNVSTPVTTFAGGTNWKQVSAINSHTAAIKTDGTLWTWGANSYGRLGNAQTTDISTPVTTFSGGTNWKQVSCGGFYTAAVKTDGTLWLWGGGGGGKIGNGAVIGTISTPVTTFAGGTNWNQVSCDGHTAAIKTDGTLWTWGYNSFARLGNASTVNVSTPVTTFSGGTDWKQVAAGGSHTAAIKTNGTLWTWGYAPNGRLGNAVTTGTISTPITTFAGGNNWKQVSAGNGHTAAIKTNGTLWTWGYNGQGRLGNAIVAGSVSTPITTFAGGTNWKQLAAGSSNTTALTYIDPVI